MFVKFVKFLAKEAYWLYQASVYAAQNKEWLTKFHELYAGTQYSPPPPPPTLANC